MNDVELKREALASSLQEFLVLCDQTEEIITGKPGQPTPVMDFSGLLDSLLPLPLDKNSIRGCTSKQLQLLVEGCTRCRLCEKRTHTVFGEGVLPPRLMVIGEGPGAEEDATGRAFVGRGGIYLDSWLSSIGLSRNKNVYIANIVKCRPPENRNPLPDEVAACLPFVKRQIQLAKPELLLLCGGVASKSLLDTTEGVGKLRGRFFRCEGIPALVTYHPAGVLRNPEYRRPVWEDLKKVASYLGIPLAGRS
ncbi:uracil-DNA glycosylase [uncultured Sphaerochaeta sp.]|uniref:uracil-DNA glycosylase n=1 Tax=uncultured Sphaerochaeta sp. TaxID=886478 RepID=UPI002A0A9245|nr:uracil-DNA glycosylase [uncultured Sphaerochaeta sp.]